MSFRKKMQSQKKWLSKRHTEQTKNKDNRGRFPSIILKNKIPAGIETFRCIAGDHLIDIIPFEAGPNMPFNDSLEPVTPEGGLDYVLDIWVHQNIGTTKQQFVCPYENFGKECPICEYMNANRLHKEDWNALRPKRRAIYLIWVHDTKETERKGVQVWNASHYLTEEKFAAIAKNPRGGGAKKFADYDIGENISFAMEGKGISTKYVGHSFYPRQSKIPDKILDQSFPLDSIIEMHPKYDVINKSFIGLVDQYESRKEVTEDGEAGSNFADHSTGDDVPWGNEENEEAPRKRVSKHKRTRKKTTGTSTATKPKTRIRRTKTTVKKPVSKAAPKPSTNTTKKVVRRRRK